MIVTLVAALDDVVATDGGEATGVDEGTPIVGAGGDALQPKPPPGVQESWPTV